MLQNGKPHNFILNAQSVTSEELAIKNDKINGNKVTTPKLTAESLGIITSKPKHPDYAVKALRLHTFTDLEWPTYLKQRPADLAEAGFFYSGNQDVVFCFFCGKGLQQWDDNDIPWNEHARWYPDCPYVRNVKGSAFIRMFQDNSENQNTVLQCDSQDDCKGGSTHAQSTGSMDAEYSNDIAMQSLIQTGYDKAIVNRAIEVWREKKGDTPYHAENILAIVFDIEDGKVDMTSTKEEQNTRHLEEIDESKGICRICNRKMVSVCFLPCGHLICCIDCAPACRNCYICKRFVQGTIRTYLA